MPGEEMIQNFCSEHRADPAGKRLGLSVLPRLCGDKGRNVRDGEAPRFPPRDHQGGELVGGAFVP